MPHPQGVIARPLDGEITILGFGHGGASISQGGVGPGSSTTFLVYPTNTVTGDFAAISGPGTLLKSSPTEYSTDIQMIFLPLPLRLVTVISGASGSEAKFQLTDGGSIDNKCNVDGEGQAACTAVVVEGGETATRSFTTQLPSGFVEFGQAISTPSPTSSPSSGSHANGALKVGFTTVGTVLSVGVAAAVLLL